MPPSTSDSPQSTLNHFASTYLKARWYLGAGLIALTGLILILGLASPITWVVAPAGVAILAHAFAMRLWDMHDATVALLVDLTATFIATMIITNANQVHDPVVLAYVGASVLIALFTNGWARAGLVFYVSGLTLATLLMVADWDVSAVLGDFIGAAFVVALIIGVLSAIRSRLVELEAARAEMIGVVSHELRNHLTGVQGAIELITDSTTPLTPEATEELLDMAHQQSTEAGEVIEDLLIASRAERGVLDAMPELVDLCPITESVIRRTSFETGEILYDFSDGPVWAMADPLRYKQILRNLLTNALRYGGETVSVSVETLDDTVSLVVSDNGDGVDPADESLIFQPYHRGNHTTAAAGSSGLGLWIARGLAQKMGGNVTYRRESSQTVFELTVPAADGPSPRGRDESMLHEALSS